MRYFKKLRPKKLMYEDYHKNSSYRRELWNVPLQYTTPIANEPEEEPEEEYEDDYE